MIELLSPVGNMKCLNAAINAGCDAVYLSGVNFGARSFAGNFSNEEILEAINTCHLYGIKVYITVNTLIYDNEVEDLLRYIDFLHKNNVDAVIMQDIGMMDLVRKTYPNLEIHASTQSHIHNKEGIELVKSLGLKRVVLARETPIELIKKIKNNTDMEIEIFVHGALCMSYSGQCLMSSLIGNRSGNRGTCAQSCRQQYNLMVDKKIVNTNKYLLSTKDLNTLNYIGDLIDIGVNSLKIEGRMKRPEYVYLVTSIYRKAIDNYFKYGKTNITNKDIKDLKKIFNREFTKGFMFHEDNEKFTNTYRPNHIGIEIGKIIDKKNGNIKVKLTDELTTNDGIRVLGEEDKGSIVTSILKDGKRVEKAYSNDIVIIPLRGEVEIGSIVLKTSSVEQLDEINNLININKKIKISGKCYFKVGEPIKFIVNDGTNIIETNSDYVVQCPLKMPTTIENINEHLCKTGNTIYEFINIDYEFDEEIFVPITKINDLRRETLDLLSNKRLKHVEYKCEKYEINVDNYIHEQKRSILIHTKDDYLLNKDKYDVIYVDNFNLYNSINDKKCVLKLERVQEHLKDYNCKLLVGELGSVYKYKNVDTDFSLNVVNSYSVALLHSLGVNKITLSYELSYKQVKDLINNYELRYKSHPNLEVIVSANEEVMVCKYNLIKQYNTNNAYLLDRFNNKYKIEVTNDLMHIFNYRRRELKDNYYDIGVNSIRLNL